LASGDLDGDGRREIVAAGENGAIRAVDQTGKRVWEYALPEQGRVNSVACANVNGDSRDEVIFGASPVTPGLLDGAGKLLWTASPPRYWFVDSDVMTVFPGDVNGDGKILWRAALPDACGDLALLPDDKGPRFLAACGRAGVSILARDGRVTGQYVLGGRPESLILAGGLCVVAKDNGALTAVAPP
jgi:outer membrane protein assembly factor BamB